jgi:hypothetical protein
MNFTTNITKPIQPAHGYFAIGIAILGLIIWPAFFTLGLAKYPGSKSTYILFSLAANIMLVLGLRQKSSFGYLFMVVFLWLGLWLKLTIHTILNYHFAEPIGSFSGTSQAWDEVLDVAGIACLGVVIGKFIYDGFRPSSQARIQKNSTAPLWYVENRKWLWVILVTIAAAVLITNMKYGLHQIVLAPRSILIWPLNAIVAWLLNIGLATAISIFIWWDIIIKKDISLSILAIIVEAFLTSISILSRAAYIFHAVPQLLAINQFKKRLVGWSGKKSLLLTLTFFVFLIISISAVTTFRNYLYQSGVYSSTAYKVAYARWEVVTATIDVLQTRLKNVPAAERPPLQEGVQELQIEQKKLELILAEEKAKWNEAMKSGPAQSRILLNEFGYQITDGFSTRILQLSMDRWIGLERLMAVQSYPEKNLSLLSRALREKPDAVRPDTYQAIANSIFLKSDITKFRFASLPGAAAFLYYSNSLWIVMLGMTLFSLIVLTVEFVIDTLTSNPILCSLYGVVMANNVVQFGVAPRQSIPYFIMLTCGILLAWVIHTHTFTLVLRKLKLVNSSSSRDD